MEERISDIEDRNLEMMEIEEERNLSIKRNERTLTELSDSIRKNNIRIIGLWFVWLSGLSSGLQTKRLPVQFKVRAHAWVAGLVPG